MNACSSINCSNISAVIKVLDICLERQLAWLEVRQVEDLAAALSGKAQWASFLGVRMSALSKRRILPRQLHLPRCPQAGCFFRPPNEILIANRRVKLTFGLRLPRPLTKAPKSLRARPLPSKSKHRCFLMSQTTFVCAI